MFQLSLLPAIRKLKPFSHTNFSRELQNVPPALNDRTFSCKTRAVSNGSDLRIALVNLQLLMGGPVSCSPHGQQQCSAGGYI